MKLNLGNPRVPISRSRTSRPTVIVQKPWGSYVTQAHTSAGVSTVPLAEAVRAQMLLDDARRRDAEINVLLGRLHQDADVAPAVCRRSGLEEFASSVDELYARHAPVAVADAVLTGSNMTLASMLVCALSVVRRANRQLCDVDSSSSDIDGDPLEEGTRDWVRRAERRVNNVPGLAPFELDGEIVGVHDTISDVRLMFEDLFYVMRVRLAEASDHSTPVKEIAPYDVVTFAYDLVNGAESLPNPVIGLRRQVAQLHEQRPSLRQSHAEVGL